MEALKKLRDEMKKQKIRFYYVSADDFHGSEYVGDYFKAQEFLTGFTGESAQVLIGDREAIIWADGRYFIQCENEIKGSGFTLYKMGVAGYPSLTEYLEKELKKGDILASDGRTLTSSLGETFRKIAALKNAKTDFSVDFISPIWENRPAMSCTKAEILPISYAGKTTGEKLSEIRAVMKKESCPVHVLSSLTDIAWVLNMRGKDIHRCPVILSYLIVDEKKATLYIQKGARTEELEKICKENQIRISDYLKIYEDIERENFYRGKRILLSARDLNERIVSTLSKNHEIRDLQNPSEKMKAVKNETEIRNIRKAHIKDGLAMTKWLCWLEKTLKERSLTEKEAEKKLDEFRFQEGAVDLSFDTISAYGKNAAMAHYSAPEENSAKISRKGFYLVDSGGHYKEGSTDITRTIAVGPLTKEQKKYYTLVLKGHLNLAKAKFPKGTSGIMVDALARIPLWKEGMDYRHGTGHGVGYLLSVHEGPNSFRPKFLPGDPERTTLLPGMVTTDEPGFYVENGYGIRIENELLTRVSEENEYGTWYDFENLTYCPIDLTPIDKTLFSKEDAEIVNQYHQTVYKTLAPYLKGEELKYLKEKTKKFLLK